MSKSIRAISLVLAAAAILAAPLAQASTTTPLISRENYTVGQGDIETVFNGNPFLIRGDAHVNAFSLNLGANYFITDIFAPGVELMALKAGDTYFRFLPNLKGYIPNLGRVLPFGQFGFGYFHAPGADLFDVRIGLGCDYLLANNVAVGLAFAYDLGVGDGTFHQISFPFGFNVYFKL
jgi:hypothetical protein